MTERTVLLKKACTYTQTPDMVSVKQLMIVGENGKKYLALRLVNERSEPVSSIDINITEYDDDGKIIASDTFDVAVSGGAGETFIPDQKIELEEGTVDCVVLVKSATYGAYVYRAEKDKPAVEYGVATNTPAAASGKRDYAAKAGKDGITVKPRKLKAPVLVMLAMIVSLIATAFAVYLHLLYFIKTETTFLYVGVEYEFENGDSSDGTDIYVVGYYGARAQIVIPEQIEGHTVKGVKDKAFAGDAALVGIKFESELPIGDYAFMDCISLKTVEFEKVTQFGSGAFKNCAMLREVVIHSGIDEIPVEAFYGCTHLESITVEASAEPIKIGMYAFAECKEIASADFLRRIDYGDAVRAYFYNSSVDSLHVLNYDFSGNKSLNRVAALFGAVDAPDTVMLGELKIDYLESIPEYFLQGVPLTSFQTLFVEDTYIYGHAFDGCSKLAEFVFPLPVTGVGDYAFSGTSLVEFDCTSLESLGNGAFADCKKLTSVVFTGNNSLAAIGSSAFARCEALTRITLPVNVTIINDGTFSGCKSLYDVRVAGDGAVISLGTNAFASCEAFTALPEMGGALIRIGDGAFSGCTGFTELTVPDTVASIGLGAFSNCKNIKRITLPFVGSDITGGNGFLAYIFGARSYFSSEYVPSELTSVTVTGTTQLYSYAFYQLESIKSISLADGMTNIGVGAFFGCKGLTEFELPDSVVSVGLGAFELCSSLKSIKMPYAAGGVGSGASMGYMFGAYSSNNNYMYVPESLKTVEITRADFIPDYAFANFYDVERIVLPDNVISVGSYAFMQCNSLTQLVIPDSVNYIGRGAFNGTISLAELSVPFIGLSRYNISAEVYAEENCFTYWYYSEYGYTGSPPRALKKVIVTDGEVIAPQAFDNCYYLEQIVLDCDIKEIGERAFYMCYRLFEVFNGSGSISPTAGQAGFGNIAEHVLAVHDGADAEPLTQVTTSTGFRFVEGDNGWYLIDCPFDENGAIDQVDLPNAVSVDGHIFDEYEIWRYLFRNAGLTSIKIPKSVTAIGEFAFSENFNMTSAVFAAGSRVVDIKPGLFFYCYRLAELTLPDTVRTIGDRAFYNCSRLKKFTVGKDVTKIGFQAFYECQRLFEIYNYSALDIDVGATDNGYVAYTARRVYTKEQLALDPNVALPNVTDGGVQYIKLGDNGTDWWAVDYFGTDGVLEIKPFDYDGEHITKADIFDGAFSDIYNVEKIVIGNTIPAVGTQFNRVAQVKEITVTDNGGAYESMAIASGAFNMRYLRSIAVDIPVSEIESGAFNSYNMTEISFSKYVDTVRENAFISSSNSAAMIKFADIGVIESSAFSGSLVVASFEAGSVDSIGSYAFSSCHNIEAVSIGSVGMLDEYAFSDCSALRTVVIGKVSEIGEYAFYACYSLEDFTVNSSDALTVGDYAFYLCEALEAFEYGGNITIGDYAFGGCRSLYDLKLGSARSVGARAFSDCYELHSVAFSGDVDYIGERAFAYIGNLNAVSFDGNVGSIATNAFYNCVSLTSVKFGGNVGSIGNYAFTGCGVMSTLEFGGSLTSLGVYAFYGCSGLKVLDLPDSLNAIPDYAFSYCSALRTVYLPKNLTSISSTAFAGSNYILTVYNPSGISAIERYIDDPVAVVTVRADAEIKYVTTLIGSTFAQITGKWYFVSGLAWSYDCAAVPESFVSDGKTITEFALAKYSAIGYGTVVVGDNVTEISSKAFSDYYSAVYYKGNADKWNTLFGGNTAIAVYYLADCLHEGDDTHWRYDGDRPTRDITVFDDSLWKTTVASSCVKEGVQEATCPHCGKKFTRSTGYIEHDIVDDECTICGSAAFTLTTEDIADIDGIAVVLNGFTVGKTGEIASTNHGNYTQSYFTVTAKEDVDITFEFSISAGYNDRFVISVNGNTVVDITYNGERSLTLKLVAGDTVEFRFIKSYTDPNTNTGDDAATVKNFTVIYTEDRDA